MNPTQHTKTNVNEKSMNTTKTKGDKFGYPLAEKRFMSEAEQEQAVRRSVQLGKKSSQQQQMQQQTPDQKIKSNDDLVRIGPDTGERIRQLDQQPPKLEELLKQLKVKRDIAKLTQEMGNAKLQNEIQTAKLKIEHLNMQSKLQQTEWRHATINRIMNVQFVSFCFCCLIFLVLFVFKDNIIKNVSSISDASSVENNTENVSKVCEKEEHICEIMKNMYSEADQDNNNKLDSGEVNNWYMKSYDSLKHGPKDVLWVNQMTLDLDKNDNGQVSFVEYYNYVKKSLSNEAFKTEGK